MYTALQIEKMAGGTHKEVQVSKKKETNQKKGDSQEEATGVEAGASSSSSSSSAVVPVVAKTVKGVVEAREPDFDLFD